MARALLVFVPPWLALGVRRARWVALLRAHRVVLAIDPLTASAADFARALWPVAAHAAFADAVDTLDLLACDLGRVEILTAADVVGRSLPRGVPPADLAALLLAKRARDPSFEPLVERALTRFLHLGPATLARELVAREARRAGDPAAVILALKEMLGAAFVDAWIGEDDDGNFHVAVFRRADAHAALTLASDGIGRRVRRDVVADTLRVDVPDGRLVVRTADPALERAYADAVGRALFGDQAFFTDAPAYSLKSAVARGSAALEAARPDGATRVRFVDIAWDDGAGAAYSARSSNALASYEAAGGAKSGYVTGSVVRLDAAGETRPVDVAVLLPDRASYRGARHERLARRAIAELGILAPGATPDDSFTVAPWVHAEWRWRRVLGDAAFERLVERGVFAQVETRMVAGTGAETGKYGWSYIWFELKSEPGKRYAVARNPALASRDVGDDEVRMWKLDLAAVGRALREDFGAVAVDGSALGEGVIDVGLVRAPGIDLRAFAVLRAPGADAKGLVDAMTRASKKAHAFVLVPAGRTVGAGIEIGVTTAELFGLGGIAAKVLARVVEKKGLADNVEPWWLAAEGVRFVAEEKTGRCWLDGVELRLPEGGMRLLLCLAKAGGKIVRTPEIERFMSHNRKTSGKAWWTAARLGEWIRESFETAGKRAPDDVDEIVELVKNRGWRMAVKCEVR